MYQPAHRKFVVEDPAALPESPVTPIGMGKASRGVDLESISDIDESHVASWMQQAAALPGFGKR